MEVSAFCKARTTIPLANNSDAQRIQTKWIEILRYLQIGDGFESPKKMDYLPRGRGNRPPDYEATRDWTHRGWQSLSLRLDSMIRRNNLFANEDPER